MDLLSNPTDDQLAAIGCCLAFVLSGGMMYVSFFLRSAGRKTDSSDPVSCEFTQTETRPGKRSTSKAA